MTASSLSGLNAKLLAMTARTPAKSPAANLLLWYQVTPAPVVVLSGPEEYIASRAWRRVRDLLKSAHQDLEVTELSAKDFTAGELMTAAAPSLFSEPRVILMSGLDQAGEVFLGELDQLLGLSTEEVTLVFHHAGGVKNKKILDQLRAVSGAIEVSCAAIKNDRDRMSFVHGEFSARSRKIAPEAARLLMVAFGSDLGGLASACQQLMDDVQGVISEEVVNSYYAGRAEVTAYQVADYALAGQKARALLALRQAVESGVDLVPIVASFASKFRTMALVAHSEVAPHVLKGMNLAPWLLEKTRRELAGWREQTLGVMIQAIADADAGVKGESRQAIYLLEQVIILAAQKGRTP